MIRALTLETTEDSKFRHPLQLVMLDPHLNPLLGFLSAATLRSVIGEIRVLCFNPVLGFSPLRLRVLRSLLRCLCCFNSVVGFLLVATDAHHPDERPLARVSIPCWVF